MTRSELVAGLRRMGLIFGAVLAVTLLASIGLGLLAGSSIRRSVSVGLYVVAVICIVLGLFQGIKPPVRPLRSAAEEDPPSPVGGMLGTRGGGPIRWATGEERGESLATSGFLLGMGVVLIVLGTIVDGRRALV